MSVKNILLQNRRILLLCLTATQPPYRDGKSRRYPGFFKIRMYEKDDMTREIRELVVTEIRLEKITICEQAD